MSKATELNLIYTKIDKSMTCNSHLMTFPHKSVSCKEQFEVLIRNWNRATQKRTCWTGEPWVETIYLLHVMSNDWSIQRGKEISRQWLSEAKNQSWLSMVVNNLTGTFGSGLEFSMTVVALAWYVVGEIYEWIGWLMCQLYNAWWEI